MWTIQLRKGEGGNYDFLPFFLFHPFQQLLVSDSLRGSKSHISEDENADAAYIPLQSASVPVIAVKIEGSLKRLIVAKGASLSLLLPGTNPLSAAVR
jgi:hypothetical protein